MADAVVIVGIGMMTAVGLSAAETAASVRSGTMRFTQTRMRDRREQPFTLAVVPEDGLPGLRPEVDSAPGLTSRERRLLRLATMPLAECVAPLADTGIVPGILLALPEGETTLPLDRPALVQRLARQVEGRVDPRVSDATHTGRAGGLTALGQGVQFIQSGQGRFIVVGGADTYRDLYVLGTLDMEQRVKSAANLDGFIPGEGAGFVLLASRSAAREVGLTPLATISPVAMAMEPGHLYSAEPYRGDGLAAAFAQLVRSGAVAGPIQEVYSSMNGESHWAKEWGVGFLRNRAAFAEDHGMFHPADCYGDLGAACGPVMTGLAALGIARRYRRSPSLVYCSSDRGLRAAIAVSACS